MAHCGNVADFLLEGKAPDAVALRMLSGDHSYGDLRRAVTQVAESLVATEPRGSRILLIGENSFFWVAAYLGTMKAGMISVPLPASLPARDMGSIVSLTEARAAFLQAAFLRNHAAEFAGLRVIGPGDLAGAPSPTGRPLPDVDSGDLAAIMFTSGSTAGPRGVMVSHANIMANTESIIQYLGLTAKDRILSVLPFHYCFGTSLLHTHLRAGASLVIDPRFMYPEAVLQRMADTECTGFAGVPSHFQILLRRSSLKKRTFPHLRYVQQAGGHLAPVFVRELRATLPQTRIFLMYGQTEATARLSYLPPELLERKPGSIGKGIPGVTLQVLNAIGQPVAPGEVGEIVAAGENVTRGYWRAPEESNYLRDGKLYTGDLATVDEDGFVYVVDRSSNFVKCGGERVSSRQIEEQLLECEELLEVAVIGTPDDLLGEAVMAFIVPREGGCTGPCHWPTCRGIRERVRLFAREHLRPKLVPKSLVVLSALPKNGAGKVLKAELKSFAIQ
jgi:long-chain acyl-CoA synthetase